LNSIEVLAETLSLTELIRLQDVLSRTITRRFEKHLVLAVSEVAGSTAYFARFGDEAGRQLLQRHLDLLQAAIAPEGGRIIEGARSSGVLLRFDTAAAAARAMTALQRAVAADNDGRRPEHHLQLRVGVHAGTVLADGAMVSGDAVNLCGGVAAAAAPGGLMLSQPVFTSLTDPGLRLRARRQPGVRIEGLEAPQDLFNLDWKDAAGFPALVRFDDGTVIRLPAQDVIRFGRLREQDGLPANDVLVSPADPRVLTCISRWHFELHRRPDGYAIRPVSGTSTTEYDGQPLLRGEEKPVRTGGKVRLGGVFSLEFLADDNADEATRRLP
jgi:class 3 adenylate cyclase